MEAFLINGVAIVVGTACLGLAVYEMSKPEAQFGWVVLLLICGLAAISLVGGGWL